MLANTTKRTVVKFDAFTVNFCSGELWKHGHRLRLPELPFRLLIILIENAGEMVTREELRQRLWPEDLFIDFDNSLNTAIAKIRRVLNDSAGSPEFIETVGRRGYRFIAAVEIQSQAERRDTGMQVQPIGSQEATGVGWWAGQLPLGVMRLDASGRILYTNPKWSEIVGFSPRQIVGEPWFRIVFAEDADLVHSKWKLANEGRQPSTLEFRVLRPDGEISWISLMLRPECEAEVITGYFATLADVNERHLTTVALKQSEQRFKALAEHLPGVVYICKNDAHFTKVYVGGPTEALNGYTNSEILSGIDTFPGLYKKEDAERIRDEVQSAVGAHRPYHLIYQFRHRSGEWKWAEEFGAGIFDHEGKLLHVECFVSDITQRRRMEERLRQSEKMEAVGTLANGIAHDFNNLLTVIRGYSQALLGRVQDPKELHQVAEIEKAASRASDLVQRLMAFSHRQFAQPAIINPNGMVREISEMLRPVIGEDIALVLRLDPKVKSFKFDATEIQQVVLNLAINAQDAMPNGGTLEFATSSLDLRAAKEARYSGVPKGEYALIRVIDTGVGMSPEVKGRIFEPFFTTKSLGRGTGLGLSSVFGMVKQNGGHVLVDSEVGVGTTFEVVFPAVETEESLLGSDRGLSLQGIGPVLVVEDDPAVLSYTVEALTQFGLEVKTAFTLNGAVGIARATDIHILMTDIRLPDGDGWTLAKQVVAIRPSVKVLYVSGFVEENAVLENQSVPGCDFLKKPFSQQELADSLKRLVLEAVH